MLTQNDLLSDVSIADSTMTFDSRRPQPSDVVIINPLNGNQKPFSVTPQLKTSEVLIPGQLGSMPATVVVPGANINSPGDTDSSVVIGRENRKITTDTTVYPWCAVCRIVSIFPDDPREQRPEVGSGALIGDSYVLTAAHVLYQPKRRGIASRIIVIPGQNMFALPFGARAAVRYLTFTNYLNSLDRNYDMALLKLDMPIGWQTGWFGFAYEPQLST